MANNGFHAANPNVAFQAADICKSRKLCYLIKQQSKSLQAVSAVADICIALMSIYILHSTSFFFDPVRV